MYDVCSDCCQMNKHADSDPSTDSDPDLSRKHGSELILPGMAYDPNAEVRVNTSTVTFD